MSGVKGRSGAYPKSDEHRRKISEGMKRAHARRKAEAPKSSGVNHELRERITGRTES